MPFDLAQLIGIIASAIIVFAFNMKSDVRLKLIMVVGSFLFAVHFYMLGAYTGAIVNFINSFRGGLSIKFHKSNKIMLTFIVIYLCLAIVTYDQIINLLPFVTGVLGCFILYQLSGIPMRLAILVSSSLWMTYNIIFMSIGGIITEMFVMSVNCITIYRLFKDKKKVDEPHHDSP